MTDRVQSYVDNTSRALREHDGAAYIAAQSQAGNMNITQLQRASRQLEQQGILGQVIFDGLNTDWNRIDRHHNGRLERQDITETMLAQGRLPEHMRNNRLYNTVMNAERMMDQTGQQYFTREEVQSGNLRSQQSIARVSDPLRGHRDFHENSDGSATYTLQQGDLLSFIAQDRLRHELGRAPSTQEIYRAVDAYARANGVDANNIPIGTELRLPPSSEALAPASDRVPARGDTQPRNDQPTQPQDAAQRQPDSRPGVFTLHPDDSSLYPNSDGQYSPSTPPGMANRDHSGEWTENERTNESRTREGNYDAITYDTRVFSTTGRFYLGTDTHAHVRQVTDRNGALVESGVEYDRGVGFTVRTPHGGTHTFDDVRRVETRRDSSHPGEYVTTITEHNGARYQATTNNRGEVTYFRRLNDPNHS